MVTSIRNKKIELEPQKPVLNFLPTPSFNYLPKGRVINYFTYDEMRFRLTAPTFVSIDLDIPIKCHAYCYPSTLNMYQRMCAEDFKFSC